MTRDPCKYKPSLEKDAEMKNVPGYGMMETTDLENDYRKKIT